MKLKNGGKNNVKIMNEKYAYVKNTIERFCNVELDQWE